MQLSFPSNATSAAQSQAVQVMETIHGFMFHFFRCDECRGHFLHYYEACWFDRCQVQSWEDLQVSLPLPCALDRSQLISALVLAAPVAQFSEFADSL